MYSFLRSLLAKRSTQFLGAFLLSLVVAQNTEGQVLWSSSGGSAWLTVGNWTGGIVPGTTGWAQFGANPTGTSAGINMNGATNNGTNNQAIGGIEVTSARTVALTISNSSTSASGTLTLNDTTINGLAHVILSSAATGVLTLGNSTTKSMTVNIAGSTNKNIVAAVGGATAAGSTIIFGSTVTGSAPITFLGNGTWNGTTGNTGGLLRFNNNSSTFSGGLTIGKSDGTSNGLAELDSVGAWANTTGNNITVNPYSQLILNAPSAANTFTEGNVTMNLNGYGNSYTNTGLAALAGLTTATWNGPVNVQSNSGIYAKNATILTLGGNVTGVGSITVSGKGTVNFAGTSNSWSGGTIINNGFITVASGSSLGAGALTFSSNGSQSPKITLNNATQTITSLSSTGFTGTATSDTLVLAGTVLTINQSSNTSFGIGSTSSLTSVITGSGKIIKQGIGVLTFTGTGNSFSGGLRVDAGEIRLNPGTGVATVSMTAPDTLNGGAITTTGIATASTITLGTLVLNANSIIDLGVAVTHSLKFAASNALTWSSGKTLTITNYTPGKGRIYFGSSSAGLTTAQLAQISFSINSVTYAAQILSTGEVVPGAVIISSVSPYNGIVGSTVTLGGSNFNPTLLNNTVYFGATKATVTGVTALVAGLPATTLTVTVPVDANFSAISVLNTATGLSGNTQYSFLPTFSTSCFMDTINMLTKVDFTVGTSPNIAAIGDIDGDGKADLVSANVGATGISVLRNTSSSSTISSSTFATKVDFSGPASGYTSNVKLADIDGDGKLDVVTANPGAGSLSVYINTSTSGSISFATRVDISMLATPIVLAIADFDGDGKPDIATANGNNGSSVYNISTILNTSTVGIVSFSSPATSSTLSYASSIAAADFDGDGKTDIAVTDSGSTYAVSVFRNASTGVGNITLGSRVDFATGRRPIDLRAADIDGDGKQDIVVTNNDASANSISVFRNTATSGSITSGSFATKVDFTAGTNPTGIAVGDINGDGKIDVAVTNAGSNTISIFKNKSTSGTIAFAAKQDYATGTAPIGINIGDLNGDGMPEVVAADNTPNTISVFQDYPLPAVAAIAGPTAVCVGATISLTDATSGTSAWTSSDITKATVDASGHVTGVAAGTAVISYSITCNGDVNYATDTITINAIPTVAVITSSTGSTSVCMGSAITLSDVTGGGAWSSTSPAVATVDASGVITPVAIGTSLISYAVTTSGCTGYATTTVTVNDIPATPASITGTATVCVGAVTTLADATVGGKWTSSDTTLAKIDTTTGIVTGIGAGNPTITYTVQNGCGSTYVTTSVTVNPLPATPAAIGGTTTTVCATATITLTDATSGGAWTSSDPSLATVDATSGVVTGVAAGNPTITYTISNTCGSVYSTVAVTVNAAPTVASITGTTTVCPSATTTLFDATGGGLWTSSNNSIATVDASGVVTGVAAGTDTITYSVTNTCGTTSVTASVNVSSSPSAGTITGTATVCIGAQTTLSDATGVGTWTTSDATLATVSSSGVVTGVAVGTPTITYTVSTGCGTAYTTASVTVNTVPSAPAAIGGTTTVCVGAVTTLTDATGAGAWTTSDATLATVSSSGVVTGVAAGSPIITYTVSNACGIAYVTTPVTVNPLPSTPATIGGASSVCVGSTTTLTDAVSGGTWTSSNAGLATVDATTGAVTGVAVGSPVITYTESNSCGTVYVTAAISVITTPATPSAITGTFTTSVGSTVTLADVTTGGSWASSNVALATVDAATGAVTGVAAGSPVITYTVSNTCGNTYVTHTFTVSAASPPSVAISNTSPSAANVGKGATSVLLQTYNLVVTSSAATITGLTVTTSGTYTAAEVDKLKCWYSTSSTFDGSATLLSTKTTSLGAGSQVFPSFTSQTIPVGTGYIFITADIDTTVTSGHTINIATTAFSNISLGSATLTGTNPVAAASAITVLGYSEPHPWSLATSDWALNGWYAGTADLHFPANNADSVGNGVATTGQANMEFHVTAAAETSPFVASGDYTNSANPFNGSSSTRMNGVGSKGFEWVTTGATLGEASLGLNTVGRTNVQVQWQGGILANGTGDRIYNVTMNYRIGATGTWTAPSGAAYTYTDTSTHAFPQNFSFGPITLPSSCNNQPVVEVRWVMRQASGTTGSRPPHYVGHILVTSNATGATPIVAISNTSPAAANVTPGTSNVLLQTYIMNVTAAPDTITGLALTTGGTYTTSDVTKLKLWYSTSATFSTSTATLVDSITGPATAGTQSFPAFSQLLTVFGGTKYFFVTADIPLTAVSGHTINVAATPFSNINLGVSATKTGTDPVPAANTQTILNPTVAITSTSPATGNIGVGTANNVIQRFNLAVTSAPATISGLKVSTTGTYDSSNITSLKCWYSTSTTFNAATATLLSTKTMSLGAGSQVFPSFTSQIIPVGTGYIYITADVSTTATLGNTLFLDTTSIPNFNLGTATVTTVTALAASNTQTISSSAVTITNTPGYAALVGAGQINVLLQTYNLSVTSVSAALTGLTVSTSGTYAAADVANMKCWYSSSPTFNSGTATLLSTIASPTSAGTQVFTSFTPQTLPVGTGYLFITTNISSTATAGNTISIGSNALSHFNLPSASIGIIDPVPAGSVQTIEAYTDPIPYNLSSGPYVFNSWPSSSALGTYPANMIFHYMSATNPTLAATAAGDYVALYNYATASRIDGLGAYGFGFFNNGSGNGGMPATKYGEAVLAINTTGMDSIKVRWTAGTYSPASGVAKIRAQYRIGTTGAYTNLASDTTTIEYTNSATTGDTVGFGPITLPVACNNVADVEIRFVYYYVSGTAELNVTNIQVTGQVPPTSSVAISSTSPATSSQPAGSSNVLLQTYALAVTTSAATISGLTVTTAGTYAGTDLTDLKCWYSTSSTFNSGTATLLSTKTTSLGTGSQVFPSFASQSLPIGTGYIYVTADIASGATVGNTINLGSTALSGFSLGGAVVTGTDPAPAANTITISGPASVLISGTSPAAGNIHEGATNIVLEYFTLSDTSSTTAANFSGMTVTTAGTYVATDFTNFKCWYSRSSTFNAATATLLSTKTSSLGAGTQVFPLFISQVIAADSTGYVFITADASSTAVIGHNINLTSTAFSNILISGAIKIGTDPISASNAQTFIITDPNPYNLSASNYLFNTWPSTSAAGTYPTSMVFHFMNAADPLITSTASGDFLGAYNLSTGGRILGLTGTDGFEFFNNGGGNIGEAVLAVNTTNRVSVQASWRAGVYAASTGSRTYVVRAQYRIGTSGAYTDLPNSDTSQIAYTSPTSGTDTVGYRDFGPITLPSSCNNQPDVEIRWLYYYSGTATGNRPQMNVTNINVTSSQPSATIVGNATICNGATTTISVMGGTPLATVLLSDGSSFVLDTSGNGSIGVHPVATTYYTGTVSLSGVTAAATGIDTVTVIPVPSTTAITGASSLCVGAATTLSDTATGGRWIVTNTSVATIDSMTGILTGVAAGLDTVSYTITNTCGTSTATTAITVNPLPATPAAISGTTTFCLGVNDTLSDGVAGGKWTVTNTSLATIDSVTGILTGVATGTDTAKYTIANTCGSNSVFTPITINGAPVVASITGTTTVNVTATTTLSDATGGGTWSSVSPLIATVDASTGAVTGQAGGIDTIKYTVTNVCGSNFAYALVTVNVPVDTVVWAYTAGVAAATRSTNTNVVAASCTSGVGNSASTVASIINSTSASSGYTGVSGTNNIGNTVGVTGTTSSTTFPYITATVNPNAGYYLKITGVNFGARSTATGPTKYAVRTSIDGFASVVDSGTSLANSAWAFHNGATISLTGAANTPVEVRIYAYGSSGTGGTSGSVNWRLDDIKITYSILPVPACTGTPASGTASSSAAYCGSGSSALTLTTSSVGTGLSYQWNSSTDGVSFSPVSGATNLTYTTPTLTGTTYYKVVTTCSASGFTNTSNTDTITINPVPATPAAISGASSLCSGTTTTFTDATTGGTWTSGNTAIATVSSSGVVTPVAAGTTNITYTSSTAYCSASVNQAITVVSSPSAISVSPTAASLCPASPAVLLVASGGALPYNTTTSSGAIAVNASAAHAVGTDSVVISGIPAGATITGVTVGLAVTSNYSADYIFNLKAPNGNILNLINQHGTSTSTVVSAFSGTSISSSSATTFTSGVVPYTGTFAADAASGVGLAPYLSNTTSWSSLYSTPNGTWTIADYNTTAFTNADTMHLFTVTVYYTNPIPVVWSPVTGLFTDAAATAAYTGTARDSVYARPASTTAYVTSVSNGSCVTTDTVNVTVSSTLYVASITGNGTLCIGDTTTLRDSTSGGSWSSSATSVATIDASTGYVTALTAGTTTITYMYSSGGCSNYAIRTITVNPLPTIAAIGGATTICTGSTATLTDATTGGTWSSGAPATATIDATTGVVTGLSQGSVPVTYTYSNGTCTSFVTTTINSYITPASVTVSPLTAAICAGSTLTHLTSAGGVAGGSPSFTNTTSYTCTPGNPSLSPVVVSGIPLGATITNVTARFSATSTYDGDFVFNLLAPNGSILNLDNAVGGSSSAGFVNTTFSSSASAALSTGTGTYTGTFAADAASGVGATGYTSSVTSWSGLYSTMNGTWKLIGYDNYTGGSSTTTAFTLSITYTVPASITWSPTSGLYLDSPAVTAYTGSAATSVYAIPSATTTYVATSTNGACTSTGSSTITVNPLPTVTVGGSTSICSGATTTITFAGDAGDTVTYHVGSGVNQTIVLDGSGMASLSVSPTVNTSYVATFVKSPAGCTQVMTGDSATVTITPATNAGIIYAPSTVCPASVTLLGESVTGGTWASNNTSIITIDASGNITAHASGTDTISYTVTGTCGSATAIALINVSSTPSGGTITGTDTVCVGSTITLADATTGGVWHSSDITVATVDSVSGVVTGVMAGSVTISYTVTTDCGTGTSTTPFVVITTPAAPPAISGTLSVCPGAVTTLSDATSGGTWTSSSTSFATVDATTGVVTGVTSGSATITYTVTNACGSNYTTASITINSLPATPPAITGTMSACIGAASTLSDATGGGVWSSTSTSLATVDASTGVVTGVAAGIDTIKYTVSNSCGNTTISTPFTVLTTPATPAAITGTLTTYIGATTTLSSTTSGGTWASTSTSVATVDATTGVVTGVTSGTSVISYTVSNTCGSASTTATVTVATPFTAGNLVVIIPTGTLSSAAAPVSLAQYTTTGTLVSTQTLPSTGSSQLTISGTAGSEGLLGLSAERDRLVVVGYDVAAGTAGVASSTSNRVIGSVNINSQFVRQYSKAVFSANNIRSGVSYGANFLAEGANTGVVLMNTAATISAGSTNNRYLQVFNGQLYSTSGSGSFKGVSTIGSGIPTSGSPAYTLLISSASTANTYGFSISPDGNTAYLADATAGILKFARNVGTGVWSQTYVVNATASTGITVDYSTTNPTIYATPSAGTSIIKVVDGGASSSSTNVVSGLTGVRGIMFAPSAYAGVSVSNTTLCSGAADTITFKGNPHATVTYTVDGGSNQTIQLDSATASARIITSSLTPGTHTYTLVNVINPSGTTTITGSATITVNTAPVIPAITGVNAACVGSTITLADTASGGTWTSSAPGVATIDATSGVVSAVTAGTTVISYTKTNSCGTTNVTDTVTVNNGPSITPGATPVVCAGSTSANLSYSGATGSPVTYSIVYDAAAHSAGFTDVPSATLSGGLINLVVPSGATAATYHGTLTVSNATCTSSGAAISVTVTAYPTASVTSAVRPCSGSTTNIIFTGTSGVTIGYKVDGGSILTATLTGGTYTLPTVAMTTSHDYKLVYAANFYCTDSINVDTVVAPIPMQWTGAADTNWSNSANWSCGTVPSATDDVTIPSGTPYTPSLGASGTAVTRNLTLLSGAILNLNASSTLTVKGRLSNSASVTGSGILSMGGTSAQHISGFGSISNLDINNGSGVSIDTGSLPVVKNVLSISGGTFATADSFILGSDSVATARIAPITAVGAYITGSVRIQQYIPGGHRAFRFWGHPFTGSIALSQITKYIDITGTGGAANGFTPTITNSPSCFRYNPLLGNSTMGNDPGWKAFMNTSAVSDTNGFHAYEGIRLFIRGQKGQGLDGLPYTPLATTITMVGTVNQGPVTVSLVKKGTDTTKDYNQISNPYPSPVDIGTIAHNAYTSGQMRGSSIYIWDPYLGGPSGNGNWLVIPVDAGVPYYLQANSSFQIRANHNGATLNFVETNKAASINTNILREIPQYISLNIYDVNYNMYDMLYVRFMDEATDNEDNKYDAAKPSSPANLNFYSMSAEGKKLGLDSRPYEAGKVIPLGISSTVAQDFIIKTDGYAAPAGAKVYLHDILLNTYTLLQQGTEYRFSITTDKSTQGDKRFELSVDPTAAVAANKALEVTMQPNPATDEVKISFTSGKKDNVNIRMMDLSGVSVYNTSLGLQQSGSVNVPLSNLASGIYMVELTQGDQKVVQRLVKE